MKKHDPDEVALELADIWETAEDNSLVDQETFDEMKDLFDAVSELDRLEVFLLFLDELEERGIPYEIEEFDQDLPI